jgi:hypothetical protein
VLQRVLWNVATYDFRMLQCDFWVVATDVFWMVPFPCVHGWFCDVAVHIFRCCSTWFLMLQYIISDVAAHNFSMLYIFFDVALHVFSMLQYIFFDVALYIFTILQHSYSDVAPHSFSINLRCCTWSIFVLLGWRTRWRNRVTQGQAGSVYF